MRRPLVPTLLITLGLVLAACGPDDGRQLADPDPDLTAVPTPTTAALSSTGSVPLRSIGPDGLTLSSPDLVPGGVLPATATCGGDRSPAFTWTPPGDDIVELALVARDLDAGNLDVWVVTGIPVDQRRSPAGGVPRGASLRPNGAGVIGWTGPCPTDGGSHRVQISLHALDRPLPVTPADSGAVVRAVTDATAGAASLIVQAGAIDP